MPNTLVQKAARDACIGAVVGALIVCGLLPFVQQGLVESQTPVTALAALAGAVIAQCALAAGLAGIALREVEAF